LVLAPIRRKRHACVMAYGLDGTHYAVATIVQAVATGLFSQFVTVDSQWIGDLQRFDGRVHRVGHVDLYTALPRATGAPTLSTRYRFDIGVGQGGAGIDAADADQIHGALAGGRYLVFGKL